MVFFFFFLFLFFFFFSFFIFEDMVHILLMLEVLFTQDSKGEDLFCGAPSGSEPSMFFGNYLFGFGLKPVQDNFQHDFSSSN